MCDHHNTCTKPSDAMDTKALAGVLATQLENNGIKRGTVKAKTFEYAFIVGVLACCQTRGEQLPAYLTLMVASGRSILD